MIPGAAELVQELFGIAQGTTISADDGVLGVSRFFFIHRLPAGNAQRLAQAALAIDCLGLQRDEFGPARVRRLGHAGGGDFDAQVFMPHAALDRVWNDDVDLAHEGDALWRGERLQRHDHRGVDA